MSINNNTCLINGIITIIYKPLTLSMFNNLFIIPQQNDEYRSKQNIIVSFGSDRETFDLMEKKYIFELCDSNIVCCNNILFKKSYHSIILLSFSKKGDKNSYFKYNIEDEIMDNEKLNIFFSDNRLFGNEKSIYNCIFYMNTNINDEKKNVLIIKKLKYGKDSHRYLFYYDSNEFTKEEIEIILYYIFCL